MNKYLCGVAGLVTLFAGIASAEASKCVENANMCVENEYHEWVNEAGRNADDYQFASAIVKSSKGGNNLPLSLNSTYQQALINAQAEIAKMEFLRQNVEIAETIIDNDGEEEKDTQISRLEAKFKSIRDKVMAWADATLDNKLSALGVDPQAYTVCPLEQKKLKFLNMIKTKAVERASASTEGFLPAQTFVACDENGQCAVGVAVSLKEQTLRLIRNITTAGASYQPEKGRKDMYTDLKNKIKKKYDFSSDLGVRMFYDSEGYPVFVAFGQSVVSSKGGKLNHSYMVQNARKRARQTADTYISMLFNSSINYEQNLNIVGKTSISTHREQDAKCNDKGYEVEEAVEDVISNLKSQITLASKTNTPGIKPLYSWVKKGEQYDTVGEIVMWSPKTAQLGNNLRNPSLPKAEDKAPQKAPVKQEGFSNRGLNSDAYDF